MMTNSPGKWMRITIFNLLIVALIGVLMRYKISYSFPWVEQKNLLHAHSHFAFAGWVTQALFTLMVHRISTNSKINLFPLYRPILIANLICAYGMLLSFPFQGYGPVSIFFSSLSLIIGFIFTVKFWSDLNRLADKPYYIPWFKAALFFNVISSAGTIYLAYMMGTKTVSPDSYLASIYYYLHFQYNGWFFFACMGLISTLVLQPFLSRNQHLRIFWLFAIACVPAYFLSALWLPMPIWVYVLVVLAAFAQVIAWILAIKKIWPSRHEIKKILPSSFWWVISLSAFALSIKLLLQLGSTIPALSKLAFGFRPIVIGYLHLVLLGVITLFIIGYSFIHKLFSNTSLSRNGLYIFIVGIALNELLLMIQGIAAIDYIPIPYVNELLFGAALILATGALLMFSGNSEVSKNTDYPLQ